MQQQQQKAKLGERFTCFSCGTKFYTLNKPEPTCPECGADQREAPVRDIRTILAATKGKRKATPVEEDEAETSSDDESSDDDELFDDMDDDEDGDDSDDDEDFDSDEDED